MSDDIATDLNPTDRRHWKEKMEEAFREGTIEDASPDDMKRWLTLLCSGTIPNTSVHPREIVRGLTLNHLQMARVIGTLEKTIERLNAENSKKDKLITMLAVASLIATVIQTIVSFR